MAVLAWAGLRAQDNYSSLEFISNKGQWDERVQYKARLSAGAFYLQKTGFTVLMQDTADLGRLSAFVHGETYRSASSSNGAGQPRKGASGVSGGALGSQGGRTGVLVHSHVYRVQFEGANENPVIVPDKPLTSYNNYFIGKDPSRWADHVHLYQGVIYKNIYEGIDLHYYSSGGSLKYDLVVHAGADPSKIVMKYTGQDGLSVKKGQLLVKTSAGTVKEWIPRAYQLDGGGSIKGEAGEKEGVECRYVLTGGNSVHFGLSHYSPDRDLVIDPVEVFCSFTGSSSDNWGYTATYDASGNAYAGGIVLNEIPQGGNLSGNGFPATTGAFQTTFQGGDGSEGQGYEYDVAIMKLSSDGSKRIYATYFGGGGDEQPHSMIVDNQGNLAVAGRTSSGSYHDADNKLVEGSFPYKNGDVVGSGGGFDIFITKFTADGSRLVGSRTIGGAKDDGVNFSPKYLNVDGTKLGAQSLRLNYGDDGRSEVIVDGSDNTYVASCTQSTTGASGLFPVTANAFQPAHIGTHADQDGVLIKMNADLSNVVFSSFLGGSADDAAFVLAINPINNNIYVSGGTASTDIPGPSTVINSGATRGIDGFIMAVNSAGTNIVQTVYVGTDGTDVIYGIQFDREGFPYVMGTTTGSWPINVPTGGFGQAGGKQFIAKLKQDMSGFVYSTAFGPGNTPYPNLSPTAFLVDRCENVYVAGWGGGVDIDDQYANSGASNLPTTSDAIKPASQTDGEDFYFFVLQKNAISQLYGTYFGQTKGNFGDHVDGGTSRFDKEGMVYEAICANCYGGARFPTTPGVWASVNATGVRGCNEAVVKISFNFAGVKAGLRVDIANHAHDTSYCIPMTVNFQDTIRNAKSYVWSFGDGSPDLATTDYAVTHDYTAVGTYEVRLIAIDPNSCNEADTVYTHIVARDDRANLDFSYIKGDCLLFDYTFVNQSSFPAGKPFGGDSFTWTFGDGSAGVVTGMGNTIHSFPAPGTYTVDLILTDTNYCNAPDTLPKVLTVTPYVYARFATPSTGCAPYNAVFTNVSVGGVTFTWDFGDGSPVSNTVSPTHLYPLPGVYTIHLHADDPTTCNLFSDTTITITVSEKPHAEFSFTPVPAVANTPTVFTNLSTGGQRFEWVFGDGQSTVKLSMDTVVHQYNSTDTFEVCLVAFNQYHCSDTVCHPVAALVNPLLDVPNAFTPGRFGQNGIVKVMGFGITHMVWKIYNRWGQMVFESNDPTIGWDGTYKGVVQPLDVYAYTLEVGYFDGTHATKKGDITLIR